MASVRPPSSSARSAARSRRSGSGRCADCGAWNSLVEERAQRGSRRRPAAGPHRYAMAGTVGAAQLYADIEIEQHARLTTGIDEFDRVLGGGVVPGSLDAARRRAGHRQVDAAAAGGGEHGAHRRARCSTAPARSRSTRSSRAASGSASARRRSICSPKPASSGSSRRSRRIKPALVIVDSVQTVFSLKFQSAPGSIGQVREAATQLLFTAKGQNIPTFLVGHITKDGSLAGPKALEHVVDTVLYFRRRAPPLASRRPRGEEPLRRGERARRVRDDVAPACARCPIRRRCFSPSGPSNAPGSAVLCSVEGSRPILVEVQALVSSSTLRQRAAHGQRHRSAAPVAAARRAREARRPEPDRRRRVREHRRRDDGGRAGVRPRRAGGDRLERPQPRHSARRPRCSAKSVSPAKSRGISQAPLRVREAAQMGFRRCVMPEAEHRSRRTGAARRRVRAGRGPDGRRSPRRRY